MLEKNKQRKIVHIKPLHYNMLCLCIIIKMRCKHGVQNIVKGLYKMHNLSSKILQFKNRFARQEFMYVECISEYVISVIICNKFNHL